MQFTKEAQELAKDSIEAIKKISKGKWEWEPEVGDWIIEKKPEHTIRFGNKEKKSIPHLIISIASYDTGNTLHVITNASAVRVDEPNATPLLHWERIEEILEGIGYYMSLPTKGERSDLWVVGFSSFRFKGTNKEFRYYKDTYVGRGKTRQEAVMRSVIALGKEIKSEKMQ